MDYWQASKILEHPSQLLAISTKSYKSILQSGTPWAAALDTSP